MREIRFRLIKDGKIVGYEKWYPGERHSPDSGMEGWAAKPRWLYSFDNKAWGIIYIEHDTKEQSTGLCDKNGKKVYGKDKLRSGKRVLVVLWNEVELQWQVREEGTSFQTPMCQWAISDQFEVIHDNPELLEEDKK